MDIAESDEIYIIGSSSNHDNKSDKKSLFINLNKATDYLTLNIR